MRYLYGEADEKFVKVEPRKQKENPLSSYKFRLNPITQGKTDEAEYDKTDVPIVFKLTPDTLLNLCVSVIDAIPLPAVYSWTIEDICKWLRQYGYNQYQNTFRKNLISGDNLLLLDASALAAMNIKDFDHIKDITRGIRGLFYIELTKFGRSLTRNPGFLHSLYKLFRLQTGQKFDMRRSDLWRKMQIIRQKEHNYCHWEILERWLAFDKELQRKELFGQFPRNKVYVSSAKHSKEPIAVKQFEQCSCLPPCECHCSELDRRPPWLLRCLSHLTPDTEYVRDCSSCISPCTCRWSSKKYRTRHVLTCLKKSLPNKYGGQYDQIRYRKYEEMSRLSFPDNPLFNTNMT